MHSASRAGPTVSCQHGMVSLTIGHEVILLTIEEAWELSDYLAIAADEAENGVSGSQVEAQNSSSRIAQQKP